MPNYQQLKQPNLTIIGQHGYCLAYVTNVFNIHAKYPTAINAWDNSSALNHAYETPPANVSIPIFFSYNGPDGHVAVWNQGTIHSTSSQGMKTFSSIEELVKWMGEGFKYLGWSEELNGVRVVEQVAAPTPPPAPAPEKPATPPEPPVSAPNYDGNAITIQPGWGLSEAAKESGYPDYSNPVRWQAIASLNGSNDWQTFNASLKAGQRIAVGHYVPPTATPETPPAPPQQKPTNTVYNKLASPMTLITNKNPTNVWNLAFPDDAHATSNEQLAQGRQFIAYGKAQRTDHDRPSYFMTQADFGDADTTGIPTFNRGINIVDLSAPPAEDQGEQVPVNVVKNAWQQSFMTFKDKSGNPVIVNYVAELNEPEVAVIDAMGGPNQNLINGSIVPVAGTFIGPDGVTYYRSQAGTIADTWYEFPEKYLAPQDDISEAELQSLSLGNSTPTVKAAAKTTGFFSKIFGKK